MHESQVALWRSLCASIPPIPALTVSEWAGKYMVLSRESSSEPGRLDLERIPYQRAAMDDGSDPDVVEAVLMWAAQLGKSTVLNANAGFFIDADPSPILFVQPTIELAEAYSKERIAPFIRDTPKLSRLVRDPRTRDSGNTLLSKVFPGGNLALVGANAPSGLAGRPRRVILQDEIDRYPTSAGTEGDPCSLADKRAENFPQCVKYKTSTPTVKGISRIENLMAQSDYQKWYVKCPHCQQEQVLMWKQIKWPEGKPEEAFLECEVCKAPLQDADRVKMVREGTWKATKPFTGIRGRWLNGLNTLFIQHKGYRNRLHQFVAEFLKAKAGGPETMKTWQNTFLAETYEEEAEVIELSSLETKVEEYEQDALPREVLIVTAGVDIQGDRIEAFFAGWGIDEELWGIKTMAIYGDPEKDEVWEKLDTLLLSKFKREDGIELPITRAMIDTGYKQTRVIQFCMARLGRGVYPCKGLNRVGPNTPPLLPKKPSTNNKLRVPTWMIGVTVAKCAIYDRIHLPTPGSRSFHFSKEGNFNELYFRQLTAEKRKKRFAFGQPYFIFEKDNQSVRNEALDMMVYALAALHNLQPIMWDQVRDNLLAEAKELSPNETEEKEQVPDKVFNQDTGKIEVVNPNVEKPTIITKPVAPVITMGRVRGNGFAHRW